MADELLQTKIKRLTTEAKRQEKKARLKHAYAEHARTTSDEKRIHKAQAEEEQALAELRRIEADRAQMVQELELLRYVAQNQPVARATAARTLKVTPERIDALVAQLRLAMDGEGMIYSDRERMTGITLSRNFAAWDEERKKVITRWAALTDAYPEATRDELKELYLMKYRDAEGIDRYFRERANTIEQSEYRDVDTGKWIILGSVILLVFLVLLVILAWRNPGAVEASWERLRFGLLKL